MRSRSKEGARVTKLIHVQGRDSDFAYSVSKGGRRRIESEMEKKPTADKRTVDGSRGGGERNDGFIIFVNR